MAVKIKIFLLFLTIAQFSIGLHARFTFVYAQEQAKEEISDAQDENNIDTKESGFFNYEYKIRIQEEADFDKRKTSLINPNNDFLLDKNYYNRTIFDVDSKLFFGKYFDVNFHDQVAWKWQENEKIDETEIKNYMQELFLVTRIYDVLIIDVGRENIINGAAFGWNPTDYMINASISANPDPRVLREQRLGAYLVKSSLFFDFGQITALFSPKINDIDTNTQNRQLYKISSKPFEKLMMEILYFREKRNSIGSNMELTLTDDLILHFEGSVTKGSDTRTITSRDVYGNNYYDFIERKNSIYAKAVLGLNYTFPDLHNLIFEFYYNGEGFSKKEWKEYFSMLEYSGFRYNSNVYEVSGVNPYSIYLTAANSMFHPIVMSRYYLFLRLSKQNIFFTNLDYSIFSFINLYDRSSFLSLNPEYSFLNHLKTGLIYSYYLGKKKSEFGLSPNLFSVLWYLGVYF